MSKQTITELIAALAVEADDEVVEVYEPDEFRRTVDSADTPARIILPSTEGDTHRLEPLGTGRLSRMEWVIKDLLLYLPVEEGRGWLEVGYGLDDYVDSYATKLVAANHDLDGFCAVPSEVISVDFLVGVQTFGNRNYYGVLATLRVIEWIK